MSNKIKNLFGSILVMTAALSFAACSNEEETVYDEWNSNYVYLERPHLGVDAMEFSQTHSSLGLAGDVDIKVPVTVKMMEPAQCDVKVTLGVENAGALPAEVQEAKEELVFTKEWKKYYKDDAAESKFLVKIVSIEPESDDLRLSTKMNKLVTVIKKGPKVDIIQENPEGSRIDRKGWEIAVAMGAGIEKNEYWAGYNQVIDDNSNSYLYFAQDMGIIFDLKGEHNVSGIELENYYGMAASKIDILMTTDGKTWKNVTEEGGMALRSDWVQYIKLIVPQKATQVKIIFRGAPALTEVYLYEK